MAEHLQQWTIHRKRPGVPKRTTKTDSEQAKLWLARSLTHTTQPDQIQDSMGPLIILAENLTDTEIDRTIDVAEKANKELHIKDMNGKETQISRQHRSGGKKTL